MKIAVCDDNPEHINALENSLFEISKARNIKNDCDAYQCGEELAAAHRKQKHIRSFTNFRATIKFLNFREMRDIFLALQRTESIL